MSLPSEVARAVVTDVHPAPAREACALSVRGAPHRAPVPARLPSQTVMSHSFHPPLMQRTSWTLAAPFKEQQHHRGPSDSIANNYSLTAQDLKLKDLLKVYQPVTVSVPRERLVQELSSGNRGVRPASSTWALERDPGARPRLPRPWLALESLSLLIRL